MRKCKVLTVLMGGQGRRIPGRFPGTGSHRALWAIWRRLEFVLRELGSHGRLLNKIGEGVVEVTMMFKKDPPGNMQGRLGRGNQDRDPPGKALGWTPAGLWEGRRWLRVKLGTGAKGRGWEEEQAWRWF